MKHNSLRGSVILMLALTAIALGLPPRAQSAAEQTDEPRRKVLLVTIRSDGFDPPELTAEKGRTLLVIHNRSGASDLELRLDRETGGRVDEVRLSTNNPNWRTVVDLQPGNYVLSEANRPDWTCRFTVLEN